MKKMMYLGRYGKVYGPFSDQEIEQFQASGKILEFSWIWDHTAQAWKALDPAPAPLFDSAASAILPEGHATGPSPKDLGFPKTSGKIPAVCHNFRAVVSGHVQRMTETGCELHSEDSHFSPAFVSRASVVLNLMDSDSGKLMNVTGRVCGVNRSEKGWSYQIRWEQRPQI